MSIYLDQVSGKMFDTLAELKAFIKGGRVIPSPQILEEEAEVYVEEDIEVEEEVDTDFEGEEVETDSENEVLEDEEIEVSKEGPFSIEVKLSRKEMISKLKNAGIDGRSLRGNEEDIARIYVEHFKLGRL